MSFLFHVCYCNCFISWFISTFLLVTIKIFDITLASELTSPRMKTMQICCSCYVQCSFSDSLWNLSSYGNSRIQVPAILWCCLLEHLLSGITTEREEKVYAGAFRAKSPGTVFFLQICHLPELRQPASTQSQAPKLKSSPLLWPGRGKMKKELVKHIAWSLLQYIKMYSGKQGRGTRSELFGEWELKEQRVRQGRAVELTKLRETYWGESSNKQSSKPKRGELMDY